MRIAVWKLPEGKSADDYFDFDERYEHYKFHVVNKLNNGKRVYPCRQTACHIFDSYDIFKLEVAISAGSYMNFSEIDSDQGVDVDNHI